jgi:hypothetical protein
VSFVLFLFGLDFVLVKEFASFFDDGAGVGIGAGVGATESKYVDLS